MIFLLGKNMTSLRVGVGLTLHSVMVTLLCSTSSGIMKNLKGFLGNEEGEMKQATEVKGIFMC